MTATAAVYTYSHCFLESSRHLPKNFPGGRAGRGEAGSELPAAPDSAPYQGPPTNRDSAGVWRKKLASGLAIGSTPARRKDSRHRPYSGRGERRGVAGLCEVPRSWGKGAGSRAPGVRMRARSRSGWAERGGGDGRGGVVISEVWTVRGGLGGHGRSR